LHGSYAPYPDDGFHTESQGWWSAVGLMGAFLNTPLHPHINHGKFGKRLPTEASFYQRLVLQSYSFFVEMVFASFEPSFIFGTEEVGGPLRRFS
jgi:hypothetical protein